MKRLLAIIVAAVLVSTLFAFSTTAAPAPEGGEVLAQASAEGGPAEGNSEEGQPAEGESAEGESGGESAGDSGEMSSEPTVTALAEADPDRAITLDGIAMGQVRQLITTAAFVYEGGVQDETLSTLDGVTEEGDITQIILTEDDEVGIAVRNTGSFVLEEGANAYTNLGLASPETVVLSNYVLDVTGTGSNDMGGFGAAVYVSDNASAELNNFRIITRGPARGAVFTRFGASIAVNDSTIYAVSDPTRQVMQGCPPGLFLEGKVRATNAVGASHATYNRSVVISQGWGALSTDSDDLYTVQGEPTTLDIHDSYIAVLTSGYGAYSDGASEDYFEGSYIDVPDYGAVETGNGIVSFKDCVINSGMYGVMTHSGRSVGNIEFIDSELHVGEAGVMLRDTANKVLFENSTIAFDGTYTINPAAAAQYGVDLVDVDAQFGTVNGVDEAYPHTIYRAEDSNCIVKLIHNSDGGSGTETTGVAPEVTIRNCVMTGDILNTAAMIGDEYTATSGPAGEGIRTPRSLTVVLEGSEITGEISLGQDTWEVTYFASGANTSQKIGYAASTELGMYREDNFGLSLSLDGTSVWNVTEDSYLTELMIEDGARIQGLDGAEVTMTVDGAEIPVAAGSYEGEIVISVSAAAEATDVAVPAGDEITFADETGSISIAADNTFVVVKEGQNMEGASFELYVIGFVDADGKVILTSLTDGQVELLDMASEDQLAADIATAEALYQKALAQAAE